MEHLMIGALVALCGWILLALAMALRRMEAEARLRPPSLPGLPIVGHLHLLKPPLHRSLHKLAQKLGPIFFIRMGSSPVVVVSSPFWAKEFWHERERDFSDRPLLEISKRVLYDCRSMVMMEYGPAWRELRKLYTIHMLSSKQVTRFSLPRFEEVARCIKSIESQAPGAVVDLRQLIFNVFGNMLSIMLFSKRSFDPCESVDGSGDGFKELVEETLFLFGNPFLGDIIPWLGSIDVQGYRKRMDRVAEGFDKFFEGVLEERMRVKRGVSEEEGDADYLDMLLRVYDDNGVLDRDSIKCVLLDLLSVTIETTATSTEWIMAELLGNPACMRKLQQDLDRLVLAEGAADDDVNRRLIRESEVTKLDYLQAVVKEALRLHPPFALIFRQMNKALGKGTLVGGFYLPAKTRVYLNLWAMGRDVSVWGEDAGSFHPERFLRVGAPDFRGQHFEFLPFGAGRRGCPGIALSLAAVPSLVANLLFAFDWEVPGGLAALDFSEGASLNAPPANPVTAIPTPRPRRPQAAASSVTPH